MGVLKYHARADLCDAAMKAIREAEAEEMRAKKAAQKAAFDAQVSVW